MMRKQRTRSHIIADLSVNHVERHVLLCGHAVERVVHDYGIDLMLWTFDLNGELENGQVFLQLKATNNLPLLADGTTIAFPVSRRDIHYWITETTPCIWVVYDAIEDVAYWLHLQGYFAQLANFRFTDVGETMTLYLSMSQRLDIDAVRTFQQIKYNIQGHRKGVLYLDGQNV
jgi:hypothetical protein